MNMDTDDKKVYAKTTFTELEQVRPDCFVDWFIGDDFPLFTDRSSQIQIHYKDEKIIISYNDGELDCTDIFLQTEKIDPIYGIEVDLG